MVFSSHQGWDSRVNHLCKTLAFSSSVALSRNSLNKCKSENSSSTATMTYKLFQSGLVYYEWMLKHFLRYVTTESGFVWAVCYLGYCNMGRLGFVSAYCHKVCLFLLFLNIFDVTISQFITSCTSFLFSFSELVLCYSFMPNSFQRPSWKAGSM